MESFDIGNHVLIELDDTRRVAGYLVSVAEDGFVLKVTHKDMPAIHVIAERLSASIRDELDKVPRVFLAAELVSRKMYSSLGSRAVMVEALAKSEEAELIKKNYEAKPLMFHEFSVPVLTFINGGNIVTIEDSDDVLEDMEFDKQVEEFNSEVDAGLEVLLTPVEEEVAEKPAD